MSDFVVSIGTDNDAFEGNTGGELARILRVVADGLDAYPSEYADDVSDVDGMSLRDVNGNTVGTVHVL